MKRTLILICVFVVLMSSCGEKELSISPSKTADIIENAVPLDEGYYNPSDQYFAYYFKNPDGNVLPVSDFIICRSNSQSSENEFGIIVAENGMVNEVKDACERYIDTRREAYLEAKAAYSPDEYEKYRDAEVYVYGNTVIYLIMTEKDAKKAIEALGNAS